MRFERVGEATHATPGFDRNGLLRSWLEGDDPGGVIPRLRSREQARLGEAMAASTEILRGARAAVSRLIEDPRGAVVVEAFRPAPEPVDLSVWADSQRAALEQSEAITLDLWDTLICRLVVRPEDVFWWLGREVGGPLGLGSEEFAAAREWAEDEARRRARLEGGEDATLAGIYTCLGERFGWNAETQRSLADAEMALERRVVWQHPFARILEDSPARERVAAYLTEMYLPAECLGRLAREVAGGPDRPVFASGDRGVSKGSGRLYEVALAELGESANRFTHFGDNPSSDIAQARAAGLRTQYVSREPVALVEERGPLAMDDPLSSLCLGLARREATRGGNVARRLGYELLGPLSWGIVHWLARMGRREGWRELWFLARDGGWLQDLWDRAPVSLRGHIEGRYVAASRRLWGLGAIGDIATEDWEFLLKAAPGMRAGDFFTRVGMDPAGFSGRFAEFGLPEPETVVAGRTGFFDPEDRDRLYHLFVDRIDEFFAVQRPLRERLLGYVESVAPEGTAGLAAFDLGWHGSAARSLAALCAERGEAPVPVHFFATWAEAEGAPGVGESAFCVGGRPVERRELLGPAVAVLEVLFTANEPTVEDVVFADGKWTPVGDSGRPAPAAAAFLEEAWAGARAFHEEIGEWVAEPLELDPWNYVDAALRRLLWQPREVEAELIGALPHAEGWGLKNHPPLLPPEPAKLTGDALVDAWESTAWPAGFLARLESARRTALAAELRSRGR